MTSIPDDSIRMHIVTADELSQSQNNIIGITARNLDNGSKFDGWSVQSQWVDSDLKPVYIWSDKSAMNGLDFVNKKISPDGVDILDLPRVPIAPIAGLEVQLMDPQDNLIKSALIPVDVFMSDRGLDIRGQAYNVKPDYVGVDVPAAFILGQPNEVRLIAFENEKPYEGIIEIEQLYGAPAEFPKQIKANPIGISKFNIVLNSAADFKITVGKQVIYPSFVIHERNIHVSLNDNAVSLPRPRVYGDVTLVANVTPVGQMPKLYIDYFDGNAWIDREIIEPSQNYKASVKLRARYRSRVGSMDDVINNKGVDKGILYVRVSSSAYATPETSQTFAVLTSSGLFECAGAMEALKFLEPYKADHPEYELLKRVAKDKSANPNPDNCKELEPIRDEALSLLATHHNPQLAIRVKTEEADALAYDARKLKQKSIANVILVIWFALGVIVGGIVVIRQMVRRKQYWIEVAASGEAELGKPIPQIHPFLAFVLFILIIGLCVSLYYMMQIL